MKQALQIELIKELIDHLDHHRTVDAGEVLVNPTSSYTSEPLGTRFSGTWRCRIGAFCP